MTLHRERTFEDEVVENLTANGWLQGDAKKYDRELALYPDDVLGWLDDTQPKELAKVRTFQNGDAGKVVLSRLADTLDKHGSLHVLRHGFKHINARFDMCQFRPAQGLNPVTLERYGNVRCRVVRQVRYSLGSENSIDLVFFVNGIPVATAELKTDFTQKVTDAIRQYKHDRPPKDPLTRREEPLLAFKRRALVHFAVSTDEVHMTTRLEGPKTEFLPFNMGHDEGAGNPPNPSGYRTAYLWERVLQRDSWLNILGNFAHLERKERVRQDGSRETCESLIFPRYHQWEAVNLLVDAARREGPGHNYLVQHSAGSGKSNSIAWLAHRLQSLHDEADRKVFDSVIVVTDRTVLDAQLQETIYQFEHKGGVVARITSEGVKSEQLIEALKNRAPVIIVTLQTFPFVLDEIRKHTSLRERAFAVIADEAHSSQTGAGASYLTKVLTAGQAEEAEEYSAEDVMLSLMESRAEHRNVSFFAFTATPKGKTLMRFGRPGPDGKPRAFHTYSMQQAIEEGFILDVLRNYTTYRTAFKLAHNGAEYDDEQVDQSRALKSLMRWVRLHPYNISQKVQVIVEHFRENVQHMLDGRAKAMVVTGSRKEAVRYKLALDKYIRQQGYTDLAALVAFSGELSDPESLPEAVSEHSSLLNPGLRGRDIRDAFATDEYQVLIIANKYQTGFDQPLLCAMYVDKRLDGITAVQTLSRLNRTYPGKTAPYVLDFVNDGEVILEAFKQYYRRAELADVTDPNVIHELQAKLDGARIYTDSEVEAFAAAFFAPNARQGDLQARIAPAVDRFRVRWREAREARDGQALEELELFRKDLAGFVRLYDFLSQIINYGDTELESRAVFFRHLLPLIAEERQGDQIDLSGVQLTHYKLKHRAGEQLKLGGHGAPLTPPTDIGSGATREPARARLSEVIAQMNDLFEGDLTDADYLNFVSYVRDKMVENPLLRKQAETNTKEQFELGDFRDVMMRATAETMKNHGEMAKQVFANERTREGLAAVLLDMVWESLRERGAASNS